MNNGIYNEQNILSSVRQNDDRPVITTFRSAEAVSSNKTWSETGIAFISDDLKENKDT